MVEIAVRLNASDESHLSTVAGIIREGGIVAFPFNGIYGLFGDMDQPDAAEAIYAAKGRPPGQKLIAVVVPERISEHVDFARVSHTEQQIRELWVDIHALGIILPALLVPEGGAPAHLTVTEGEKATILNIWTEYHPLRKMIEYFHALGGRGLVGTSANKSGEQTHHRFDSLCRDFSLNVNALVEGYFDHLPPERRKSTTIIDLTGSYPRLRRAGNVSEEELRQALSRHEFPELMVEDDVIKVKGRVE